jgi:hypothetical protein
MAPVIDPAKPRHVELTGFPFESKDWVQTMRWPAVSVVVVSVRFRSSYDKSSVFVFAPERLVPSVGRPFSSHAV